MANKKFKEIAKIKKEDRNNKIKDLKVELAKARIDASKGGSSKVKGIKKAIARILTLNNSEKEELKQE